MFAKVLLFQKVGPSEDTLTYKVPEEYITLKPGALIEIPLRRGITTGILLEKTENTNIKGVIKPIAGIIHPEILTRWQLDMLDWLSQEYLAPKWKIAKQLIPEHIREQKIKFSDATKTNNGGRKNDPHESEEKQLDYELVHDRETFLLHLKKHISRHKEGQTLIVVPEIAIEPFWLEEIEKQFSAANWRKAKTPKQKALLWKEIFKNRYKVIIGSRSAFFAPLRNLKNIIIINEHHIGHKEDQRPKFHSRDMADFIARQSGAGLTHLSASISLSMWHKTSLQPEKYRLKVPTRRTDIDIRLIDMRIERKRENFLPLGEEVLERLKKTVAANTQAILFLNKKGHGSCLLCKDCGYIPKCAVCSRNMIVKKYGVSGMILYCIAGDKTDEIPEGCPRCGSTELKMIGTGQEKMAEILRKEIPNANIALYSTQEFKNQLQRKKILENFRTKKTHILITSELLHGMSPTPEVPLVCEVNIDTMLTIPNFQSGEKSLHHLQEISMHLQSKGTLVIQSHIPETALLRVYTNNTLQDWYDTELMARKTLNYPPWSTIIFLTSAKKERMKETLENTMHYLLETRPHLSIQQTVKMMGHIPKHYLVIRGANSRDDMAAIKKMPDIILDIDSPYLM